MGTTVQAITQALQHGELQAFGLAMPRLAPDWSPQGTTGSFSVVEDTLTITATANWAAPLDMSFVNVDPTAATSPTPMPVTLMRADGTMENGKGVLLTLFDQSFLRLGWLYTSVLEQSTTTRPEWNRGLPVRPVPRYIFFPEKAASLASGMVEAWADLGFSGAARFYDRDGLPIDPVAVMAAFAAILTTYPVLQSVSMTDSPIAPLPLTSQLATLAPSPSKTRLHLVTPSGTAYPGTHLTGLTAVAAVAGLYDLSGASVGLDAASDTFPQTDRDRTLVGPSTSGRLMGSWTPPALATGVTLARDFFSLRIIQLDPYLVGDWPAASADPAAAVQRRPAVRVNENVTLLGDGNDLLGAINTALAAGSNPTLAVAQAIDGGFSLPASAGTAAHWPQFPSGLTADPGASLSADLKSKLTFTANWSVATATDWKKADVVLQVTGLPGGAWVRVYPRKFLPDAMLTRGDGKGRPVPTTGPVTLNLTDPFSLRDALHLNPGDTTVPADATLMFDLAVVLPNGKARMYGGNTVHVDAAPGPADSFVPGTNACGTATFRGVSNAGILGLGGVAPAAQASGSLADWAKLLSGETQPRDASRLPTMARREMLAAGLAAGAWTGVIAGGRIAPETVSAQNRVGAPGSLGGRETSVTGASTHGGLLAYDIARHALRRSQDVFSRLKELNNATWAVPTEPAQVALGGTAAATNGTMAGAVLQTIAPFCETPELHAAWSAGVNVDSAIQFVIDNLLPNDLPLRSDVIKALNDLKTKPAAPAAATETSAEQRMAVELEREITSSFYGRRDAQWALNSAIATARHLIYIETPGFCSTVAAASAAGYAADLIGALKARMAACPGLRVIVAVPKNADFAPGYEGMATYEVQDRYKIVFGQTTDPVITPLQKTQAVVFHPVGFPGRFSRLETNVVIVDDVWAMIGGATLRRRGLTFDGSSDLVLTDTLLEDGRSVAIRDFRRGLMAQRLGVAANSTEPTYIALAEPATAFRVITDAVAGGGQGNVTSVWNGVTPGQTSATALPPEQANPEGRELDFVTAGIIATLGKASGV